ncbi:larval cuticle protein 65Ag1-like [Ischnura elegans]|uniref:larval cuticle protein 65Ag1-like n=1 Tax=Ischnura elegans TaxID=197161 RepID=UPI001ED89721|nr:larval cuticle protein 65Ag1-like [Ischnura elegans]
MNTSTCFVLIGVFACANAAFVYRSVPILRFDNSRTDDGHSLNYLTGDGTSVYETGRIKNVPGITRSGAGNVAYVKEGSYSFTSPEGQFYKVDYVADENGYRPSGAHLPRAPDYNPYSYSF